MSGVNPVVLIQMILNYHQMGEISEYQMNPNPADDKKYLPKDPRTFVFQKNNTIRVHKETEDEVKRRKSNLSFSTIRVAENAIRRQLGNALKDRIGKVWIDPKLEKLAVPLQTATGNSGFGVLPTGSRIKIPEGKFIRAFTYWEKVNDIDLSAFALTEDGRQKEFSWRNMWDKQGNDITYSGDQTSGYYGGSEYLDINIELFKRNHPDYRYLVFCNNVYSGINFSQCDCKAGFMIRGEYNVPLWKGEKREERKFIGGETFDPKTVATSYRINAESTFAYLFAIDLETREMVWLNLTREGHTRVAGTTNMGWLMKYLNMANVFNLKDLYTMASEMIVSNPAAADILVTDKTDLPHGWSDSTVHSWDFEKMLSLLKVE